MGAKGVFKSARMVEELLKGIRHSLEQYGLPDQYGRIENAISNYDFDLALEQCCLMAGMLSSM